MLGGAPVDPRGHPAPSWRASVAAHEALLGSLGPYGRQAAAAWHKIQVALALGGRDAVRATLAPPHALDTLSRLRRCGWHPSLVALCSVVDGQATLNAATLDVVRARDAALGLLGALPAPAEADGATLHLLPLVTARTRSTLRPPGGQSARPVWIPLTAVPASGERAVVDAAGGAMPALLARRLEVNVATGAVRLKGAELGAGAVRASGGTLVLGWLDRVADRMLKAAAAASVSSPLRLLDVVAPFIDGARAGPWLRLTAWALATPTAEQRVVFTCCVRVCRGDASPSSVVFVHGVCVRREGGDGDDRSVWRAPVDAPLAPVVAVDGVCVMAADRPMEVVVDVDVDVDGVRRLVPAGTGWVSCWGGAGKGAIV